MRRLEGLRENWGVRGGSQRGARYGAGRTCPPLTPPSEGIAGGGGGALCWGESGDTGGARGDIGEGAALSL